MENPARLTGQKGFLRDGGDVVELYQGPLVFTTVFGTTTEGITLTSEINTYICGAQGLNSGTGAPHLNCTGYREVLFSHNPWRYKANSVLQVLQEDFKYKTDCRADPSGRMQLTPKQKRVGLVKKIQQIFFRSQPEELDQGTWTFSTAKASMFLKMYQPFIGHKLDIHFFASFFHLFSACLLDRR